MLRERLVVSCFRGLIYILMFQKSTQGNNYCDQAFVVVMEITVMVPVHQITGGIIEIRI